MNALRRYTTLRKRNWVNNKLPTWEKKSVILIVFIISISNITRDKDVWKMSTHSLSSVSRLKMTWPILFVGWSTGRFSRTRPGSRSKVGTKIDFKSVFCPLYLFASQHFRSFWPCCLLHGRNSGLMTQTFDGNYLSNYKKRSHSFYPEHDKEIGFDAESRL